MLIDKGSECFELAGFLAEVTGRTDEAGQAWCRDALDRGKVEKLFAAKVGDGAGDVCPRGILSKDGPDDDLKARAARPPMLRAIYGKESLVISCKDRQGSDGGQWMGRLLRPESGDTFRQVRNFPDGF